LGLKPVSGSSVDVRGLRYRVHSADRPWSVQRFADHLRFEVRPGDRWRQDAAAVERAQISSEWKLPYAQSLWTAFALKIENGAPISVGWTSLVGLHQSEDPHDAPSSGCFTLHTSRSEFVLITRSSPEDPLPVRARDEVRWRAPLLRGQWLNFVIRFVVDPHGRGACQVWRDGMLVTDPGAIPLGYVDRRGPYLKYGFYRPEARETTVVHFSNIEISLQSLAERIADPLPIFEGA
jgi:hypothetical protein